MSSLPAPIGITILGSGSKGNATLIHCGNDAILIDAGFSCREICRRISSVALPDALKIHAILLTHEHGDHAAGAARLAAKLATPLYATTPCAFALNRNAVNRTPVNTFSTGTPFSLLNFRILPFTVPHDAADTVGFTVTVGEHKIGLATDFGICTHAIADALKDCSLLILESNHDPKMLEASKRPPRLKIRIRSNFGHLSNAASCDLLERVISPRLQHLVLAHLSEECNTPELARVAAEACLQRLQRTDVDLIVASQGAPLPTIWLQD